jgi:hypothetical protein
MTDISQISDVVDKMAGKLSAVIQQYGPQAADFALNLGRIEAAQGLGKGVALAAISFGCWKVVSRLVPKVKAEVAKNILDQNDFVMMGGGGASLALTIAGGVCAISALLQLTDMYLWIGLFRPEFLLAAKALGL